MTAAGSWAPRRASVSCARGLDHGRSGEICTQRTDVDKVVDNFVDEPLARSGSAPVSSAEPPGQAPRMAQGEG